MVIGGATVCCCMVYEASQQVRAESKAFQLLRCVWRETEEALKTEI